MSLAMSNSPQRAQWLFSWQGIDSQGALRQGELAAQNLPLAQRQIISQGCFPTKIRRGVRLNKRCWRPTTRITIIRQLATLLQAGLPLLNSLQLLADQHDNPAWRYLLGQIQQQVAQGNPLSSALAQHPQAFPALYQQVIATGELTGKLDNCCAQLADQQERRLQMQKKVHKALRYPLFVLCVALLVTLLMLTLVLPQFAEIYQSFQAMLPTFTLLLIAASDLLLASGHYLALLITALAIAYRRWLQPQESWRRQEQRWLLQLPLISPLIINSALSRLFRTLAMTQSSGLTLLDGLQAAGNSENHLLYAQAIEEIRHQVSLGMTLQDAVSQQPLFPPLTQQLIRVGEESGTLDAMLERLAVTYEQRTEELAEQLSQALEPLLMVVVGGIVGVLVIAMYLPIFQLGEVIG